MSALGRTKKTGGRRQEAGDWEFERQYPTARRSEPHGRIDGRAGRRSVYVARKMRRGLPANTRKHPNAPRRRIAVSRWQLIEHFVCLLHGERLDTLFVPTEKASQLGVLIPSMIS